LDVKRTKRTEWKRGRIHSLQGRKPPSGKKESAAAPNKGVAGSGMGGKKENGTRVNKSLIKKIGS